MFRSLGFSTFMLELRGLGFRVFMLVFAGGYFKGVP